jgi:hypothetical protein
MFKLAVVLSTMPSHNIFRRVIEGSFNSGYLTDFLICSGFFHERTNSRGAFYASNAFDSAKLPNSSEVTVVGAYDPASTEFDDFCQSLKSHLKTKTGASVPVHQRRALKKYANKWHAKIYIAKQQKDCRLAVIGSSNLTRSAFAPVASNNESDVIIWDDSHQKTRHFIDSILLEVPSPKDSLSEDGQTILVGNYNQSDRRNNDPGSMQDRLSKIWRDVMAATA